MCTVDSITARKLERSVYFERKNIKNLLLMKIWVHLLERETWTLWGGLEQVPRHMQGTSQRENKQTFFHTVHKKFMHVREL